MQNKRGISQAFTLTDQTVALRRATVFDVFDLSAILRASIQQLCVADHGNDPERIAEWTANKTPEALRAWLNWDHEIWLATLSGRAAGVGALTPAGEISRLYVAPHSTGQGIGAALLAHLEMRARESGFKTLRLDSTVTAREFYLKQGWQLAGTAETGPQGPCHPMIKPL